MGSTIFIKNIIVYRYSIICNVLLSHLIVHTERPHFPRCSPLPYCLMESNIITAITHYVILIARILSINLIRPLEWLARLLLRIWRGGVGFNAFKKHIKKHFMRFTTITGLHNNRFTTITGSHNKFLYISFFGIRIPIFATPRDVC
jgi:hypothetical protein